MAHNNPPMAPNGGNALVCVHQGLGPIAQPSEKVGYLIDHDFFVNGQLSIAEIKEKLTPYHQTGQRFFLWRTGTLHHNPESHPLTKRGGTLSNFNNLSGMRPEVNSSMSSSIPAISWLS